MKALEVANDREERFLADFIDIFQRKMRRKLKDEFSGNRIKAVEQFVPRVGLPSPASADQFAFALRNHGWKLIETVTERELQHVKSYSRMIRFRA